MHRKPDRTSPVRLTTGASHTRWIPCGFILLLHRLQFGTTPSTLWCKLFMTIQTLIKLGRWMDAIEFCDRALHVDPGYVKALSRRATAFLALSAPEPPVLRTVIAPTSMPKEHLKVSQRKRRKRNAEKARYTVPKSLRSAHVIYNDQQYVRRPGRFG